MEQTGGLVSAYQLLDCSAQRVLAHNLAYTSAADLLVEIVSVPDMVEKLRESEIIKVRVPPLYNQVAFIILSRRVPIQVYEDSILVRRGDLKILDEAGISYEAVD